MKLVLCSEGFHSQNTVQACAALCGKPQKDISVAIINEAHAVESGDKRWVLSNLNDVAMNFQGQIDIVSLLALPIAEIEARIMAKDVIFVIGGNADYQMKVFVESGFAALLPKLLQTKVYVGSSAGSMVMGKKISSAAYHGIYGSRADFGIQNYLGLVNMAILPHLGSSHFPNCRPDTIKTFAQTVDFPVYGLGDNSAIVVDGDRMSLIGDDSIEINKE